MSDQLPTGWLASNLQQIAVSAGGGTPSKVEPSYWRNGSIPWVSPKDMKTFVLHSSEDSITEKALDRLSLVPPESVLVVVRSGILSRTLPVALTGVSVTINQDMRAFIPETGISAKYLAWQLIANERQLLNECSKHGTTVASMEGPALARFPLFVAPAAEQTRIVAKLEELLSDLDAGVAELKAAQKKLAQYRQSLLKAAVEGADSCKPYPKSTLGELVTSIGQGWSPKCEPESATDNERWAVMKTTAIQPLGFDGSHNKALPADLVPRVNLELKSGDLLVTRAGPRNRVGITCLVRKTRPKLILCDKAYRIRCNEELIDPSFLELVLNAPHIVQRIDELKTGISDSGLNLTQDRFFTLEIPLPSIEEQRFVVERINSQVASIRDQEESIELSLKQSTAQRQNILRAAFSGQLVPQDPNDEPASVLLERIRAERAAREAGGDRKRGRKKVMA